MQYINTMVHYSDLCQYWFIFLMKLFEYGFLYHAGTCETETGKVIKGQNTGQMDTIN